jgi:hypothetical protein
MKTQRASGLAFAAAAVVLLVSLVDCRSGPIEGWSSRARTMVLTSGPTGIALSSSKVPGYWAKQADTEQEFFLYTKDRSFEKGDRVRVEGPYGLTSPAVFRDESGVYSRYYSQLYVLVVWKIGRSEDASPS